MSHIINDCLKLLRFGEIREK